MKYEQFRKQLFSHYIVKDALQKLEYTQQQFKIKFKEELN